jgi:hypothetical protein
VVAITPRITIYPQIEFSAAYQLLDLDMYECDIAMLVSLASIAE